MRRRLMSAFGGKAHIALVGATSASDLTRNKKQAITLLA